MAILVVSSILGAVSMVAAIMAWRGNLVAAAGRGRGDDRDHVDRDPGVLCRRPDGDQGAGRVRRRDHRGGGRADVLRRAAPGARHGLSAVMIAIVTILLAFPLGFFLRSHLAANTAYAIAYLWAFVFQGIYLMLETLTESKRPRLRDGRVPALVRPGHPGDLRRRLRAGRARPPGRSRPTRAASGEARSSLTGTIASAASGNTAASANVAG